MNQIRKYRHQKAFFSIASQQIGQESLIEFETIEYIHSIALINKNLFFTFLCKSDGNIYESKQSNISLKMISKERINTIQQLFQYLKQYQVKLKDQSILQIAKDNSILIKYSINGKATQKQVISTRNYKVKIITQPQPTYDQFQICIATRKQELGQQQRLLNCQNINRQQLKASKKQTMILEKECQHKNRLVQLMRNTINQQVNAQKQLQQTKYKNGKKMQQLKERIAILKKQRAEKKCYRQLLTQNIQQINQKLMKATGQTKIPKRNDPSQASKAEVSSEQKCISLAESQQIIDSDGSLLTIQSAAIQLTIVKRDEQFLSQSWRQDMRLYRSSDLKGIQHVEKLISFIQKEAIVRQSVVGILNKMCKNQKSKQKHKAYLARKERISQIKPQLSSILQQGSSRISSKKSSNRVYMTKQDAKTNNCHQNLTKVLKKALEMRQKKIQKPQFTKSKYVQKDQNNLKFNQISCQKSISGDSSPKLKSKKSILLPKQDSQLFNDFFTQNFYISKKSMNVQASKQKIPFDRIRGQKVHDKFHDSVIQVQKVSNKNYQVIQCFKLNQQRKSFSVRIVSSKKFNIKIGVKGIAINLRISQLRSSSVLKQRFFLLQLKNGTILADGMVVLEENIRNKQGQVIKVEIDFQKKTIEWSINAQCFSFIKIPKSLISGGSFEINSYVQIEEKGDRIQIF